MVFQTCIQNLSPRFFDLDIEIQLAEAPLLKSNQPCSNTDLKPLQGRFFYMQLNSCVFYILELALEGNWV